MTRAGGNIISAVIFDVGNVLLQWDPRFLYARLLPDSQAVDDFLATVCTSAWNLEQDLGRSWADAVAERVGLFPEHEALIRAFDERWHEMVPGEVPSTVELLEALAAAGMPLYALTNFSVEKFAEIRERFPFFRHFRGIVVSGEERIGKPDPRIYQLTAQRYGLDPARSLFIDDSPANVAAALEYGFQALRFTDADTLRVELAARGLPVAPAG